MIQGTNDERYYEYDGENKMSELEDRVNELECENEELRDKLSDLESRFESFANPVQLV